MKLVRVMMPTQGGARQGSLALGFVVPPLQGCHSVCMMAFFAFRVAPLNNSICNFLLLLASPSSASQVINEFRHNGIPVIGIQIEIIRYCGDAFDNFAQTGTRIIAYYFFTARSKFEKNG